MPGSCGPNCPGKPDTKRLVIGGQEVGIADFDTIIAKGLENLDKSDSEQKNVILRELKTHNHVPEVVEREYLQAIWEEFRQVRAKRLGQLEERYHGIPRDEIHWCPSIDEAICTACSECAKFCKKGVYTFDDKPHVTNPSRCVVTCTGCLKVCPEGAISFPTLVSLRDELRAIKKKHGILS